VTDRSRCIPVIRESPGRPTASVYCFLTIEVVEVRFKLSELFRNPLFVLRSDVLLTIKAVEIDR
jgi:hypothetical protein